MPSFKKTLEIYKKLKKDKDKFPSFFFLHSQKLFEIIRNEKKNKKQINLDKFFFIRKILIFFNKFYIFF